MLISEYLDKCKEKLGISSTYGLAKFMNIDERRLHEHYKGIGANEYVYFKIAQILEIDAAYVIADIKKDNEKDEVKREFFKSFVGLCRKLVISSIFLASIFCGQGTALKDNVVAFFKKLSVRIMGVYVELKTV